MMMMMMMVVVVVVVIMTVWVLTYLCHKCLCGG
jgi:hypothetical protein